MKLNKIIYWSATILLSALLLLSAGMYIFNNEAIRALFIGFGYPTYIIYPLAVAKILAVTILLWQKRSIIKEWVYSALFFEFLLAFFAHLLIADGEHIGAVIALTLLMTSYFFGRKVYSLKTVSV